MAAFRVMSLEEQVKFIFPNEWDKKNKNFGIPLPKGDKKIQVIDEKPLIADSEKINLIKTPVTMTIPICCHKTQRSINITSFMRHFGCWNRSVEIVVCMKTL